MGRLPFPRHRNLLWRIGRGNSPPLPPSPVYSLLDPLAVILNGVEGHSKSNKRTAGSRKGDNRDITRVKLKESRGMYLDIVSLAMAG